MVKYWSQKPSIIVLRNLSVMAYSVSVSLVQSKILTHMIANLKVSALVKLPSIRKVTWLPNLSLVANVWVISNSLRQLLTSGSCVVPHLLWVFCLTLPSSQSKKSFTSLLTLLLAQMTRKLSKLKAIWSLNTMPQFRLSKFVTLKLLKLKALTLKPWPMKKLKSLKLWMPTSIPARISSKAWRRVPSFLKLITATFQRNTKNLSPLRWVPKLSVNCSKRLILMTWSKISLPKPKKLRVKRNANLSSVLNCLKVWRIPISSQ